ncbi:MAG: hypothetical protein AB8C13_04495 [Phycisphaerales bacterium]
MSLNVILLIVLGAVLVFFGISAIAMLLTMSTKKQSGKMQVRAKNKPKDKAKKHKH